ncbi:hypothetical protein TNCV_3983581 [Trichonephila clavipes]|nr:hypothetical protein TNCV_3983581 [Trichonephila clavipes]
MRRRHSNEDQFESEEAGIISTGPTSKSKQGQVAGIPEEVVNNIIVRRSELQKIHLPGGPSRRRQLEVIKIRFTQSFYYIFFGSSGRKNYCKETSHVRVFFKFPSSSKS